MNYIQECPLCDRSEIFSATHIADDCAMVAVIAAEEHLNDRRLYDVPEAPAQFMKQLHITTWLLDPWEKKTQQK